MSDQAGIQVFDPKVYVNAIRDRIKGAVIDVIPPETWDAMITKEMEEFFQDRQVPASYNRAAYVEPSKFRVAIQAVLEEDAKKRVKEMLEGPDWKATWENGADGVNRAQASDQIKDLVRKHSGEILEKWVASSFQQVLQQMAFTR